MSGKLILLVDESGSNRKLFSQLLETLGHSIQAIHSRDQALAELDDAEFEVVIANECGFGTQGTLKMVRCKQPSIRTVLITNLPVFKGTKNQHGADAIIDLRVPEEKMAETFKAALAEALANRQF